MTTRNLRLLIISAAFVAGLIVCFGAILTLTGIMSRPIAQMAFSLWTTAGVRENDS